MENTYMKGQDAFTKLKTNVEQNLQPFESCNEKIKGYYNEAINRLEKLKEAENVTAGDIGQAIYGSFPDKQYCSIFENSDHQLEVSMRGEDKCYHFDMAPMQKAINDVNRVIRENAITRANRIADKISQKDPDILVKKWESIGLETRYSITDKENGSFRLVLTSEGGVMGDYCGMKNSFKAKNPEIIVHCSQYNFDSIMKIFSKTLINPVLLPLKVEEDIKNGTINSELHNIKFFPTKIGIGMAVDGKIITNEAATEQKMVNYVASFSDGIEKQMEKGEPTNDFRDTFIVVEKQDMFTGTQDLSEQTIEEDDVSL